ncbi:type VI secretion system membrane subunit TssM [Zavarzinia sp.]|uniref:type VI secretion system membrane subunit TssM n=1 Tax=Zavarzinia sp. TaxID=2027920 RepID=UPI003564301F
MLKRILLSSWLWTLIGIILLSVFAFFLGPYIEIGGVYPLGDSISWLASTFVMFMIWSAYYGIQYGVYRAASKRLEGGITAEEGGDAKAKAKDKEKAGDKVAQAEVQMLKGRFEEAIGLLKKSAAAEGRGRHYLYDLPWYVIIGPPGSGKTTALVNSGLRFPLAEKLTDGKPGAIAGIGGTRACDWWFTDDAVLIDTAGRYTTQDSDAAADAKAWSGFLDLLKKNRPRQPLNGVVVAIGILDLLSGTKEERVAHATAIRARLAELYDRLRVKIPVYVLFTKADLLAGFVEYFDDLGKTEREQVLGFTFPLDSGKGEAAVTHFDAELDVLVSRLNERLVDRLQAERDIERRTLAYGFPSQLASLKETCREFLDGIFLPTRFEERPVLRGVYFTSGTQTGTPFDRLAAAMAAQFGVDRQRLPAFAGPGRSYFLTRLLRAVMFNEAGLVGRDAKAEKRRRWIARITYGLTGLITVGAVGVWALSYLNNKRLIDEYDAAIAAYNEASKSLDLTMVDEATAEQNMSRLLDLLNRLRSLAGVDRADEAVPFTYRFGLYQGDDLREQANEAYHRALEGAFRPRLLLILERKIKQSMNDPEALYGNLKAYRILAGAGPLDAKLLHDSFQAYWSKLYDKPEYQDAVTRLVAHVDTLVQRPLDEVAQNTDVTQAAADVLTREPLAKRVYFRIKQAQSVTQLPFWRLGDKGGRLLDDVYDTFAGNPPSKVTLPGLFTYDGFYKTFLPMVPKVVREATADSWVVGVPVDTAQSPAALAKLEGEVVAQYEDDYIQRWDEVLRSLRLKPLDGGSEAVLPILAKLSAPDSPMKLVTAAIAKETDLGTPPPAPAATPAGAAGAVAGGALPDPSAALPTGGAAGAAASALGFGQVGPADGPKPGQRTSEHFAFLRKQVVAGEGGQAPIDEAVAGLKGLFDQLNQLRAGGGSASGGAAAAQQVQILADRLGPPLSNWLAAAAAGGQAAQVSTTRAQINEAWTGTVAQRCQTALKNRYPFSAGANDDVPVSDFQALFAPNGLIDGFFRQNLDSFVDTSGNSWSLKAGAAQNLGIPAATLAQLRSASVIRDAFVPSGQGFGFQYTIEPVALDPGIAEAKLEIDGVTMSFNGANGRPTIMSWPAAMGGGFAQITLTPSDPAQQPVTTQGQGAWAAFRLFDQASLANGASPAEKVLRFTVGGRFVTYRVKASGSLYPFKLPEIRSFKCPASM